MYEFPRGFSTIDIPSAERGRATAPALSQNSLYAPPMQPWAPYRDTPLEKVAARLSHVVGPTVFVLCLIATAWELFR